MQTPLGQEDERDRNADRETSPARGHAVELGPLSVSIQDAVVYSLKQRVASQHLDPNFANAMIDALQSGELRFPVVPKTAMRVQQMMLDSEVSIEELGFAVNLDPALATKIVGVANSAYYKGVDSVVSVEAALMRLGLAESSRVIIAVAMRSSLFKLPGFEHEARSIWHHSLLTARINDLLLEKHERFSEMAFLLGLVHDVGHIVAMSFGARLARGKKNQAEFPSRSLVDSATQLHTMLGGLVVESWRFNDDFVHSIRHHHDEPDPLEEGERSPLLQALRLADIIAHRIEEGWSAGATALDPPIAEALDEFGVHESLGPHFVTQAQDAFGAITQLV